jgi:hypothetical protein
MLSAVDEKMELENDPQVRKYGRFPATPIFVKQEYIHEPK